MKAAATIFFVVVFIGFVSIEGDCPNLRWQSDPRRTDSPYNRDGNG
jgi:hypothetical protein